MEDLVLLKRRAQRSLSLPLQLRSPNYTVSHMAAALPLQWVRVGRVFQFNAVNSD